jgi:mono/diheme cytochrome c family protein
MRVALLVVLAACDWSLNRMGDQPRCDPDEATPYLPDRRCDQAPPAGTVIWHAPPRQRAARTRPPDRVGIQRGADRFARFCAPCHGVLGDGRSPVAADMLLRPPPSLHEPRIVAATDEHVRDVIELGFGLMPSYARVLSPDDRWAVIDYVRVLQTSQRVPLDALPADQREAAERALAKDHR